MTWPHPLYFQGRTSLVFWPGASRTHKDMSPPLAHRALRLGWWSWPGPVGHLRGDSHPRASPAGLRKYPAFVVGKSDRTAIGCGLDANRHALAPELAESGTGDEVIMSISGHVSRVMLSRYSHVRMEAKRRALDEIAVRQRAADEKRNEEGKKLVSEGQLVGTVRVQ
jgi:hypothetical protein